MFQYNFLDWKFESENNAPWKIERSRKAFNFEFVCGDWILSQRIETNEWLIIINTKQKPIERGNYTSVYWKENFKLAL